MRRSPVSAWRVFPAALLVLPPVVWLVWACAGAIAESGPAVLDSISLALLGRSIRIAVNASALAVLMGALYGWCVLRYPVPGRRLLLPAAVFPLLLPPYAAAHAWILLTLREGPLNRPLLAWHWLSRPFSAEGCPTMTALILSFCYWPVVAGFVICAARSVPCELEDAARLHTTEGRAALWSAWPALKGALPAAGLLVFLLALADFGVSNTLSVPTYAVQIANEYQVAHKTGMVARLAVPLVLLVLLLVWLQRWALERTTFAAGSAGQPRLLRSRASAWLSLLGVAVVLTFSVLLPLGTLAAHSLPLETYPAVWAEGQDHIWYTLTTSLSAALIAVAAALITGRRGRGHAAGALDLAITLPYALPASLIGIAMIQLLNRPGPMMALYKSAGVLVWTYVVLFYPFAHRIVALGWKQVDPELLDEGRVLGAGSWGQFRHAAWPSLRPWAAGAAALVTLLAAREVDATALVHPPSIDTIAFRIYDYLHFAPGPQLAALCVLLVVLSFILLSAIGRWAWRSE